MPSAPRRRAAAAPKLAIRPLTAGRWPDLVTLFGPRGACAGCWCTWWRLTRPEFDAGRGAVNRRRQERYVKAGNVAGLLAYAGDEPVGWVAIEPREAYPRLARSWTLAPVDGRPVWSITCFFVAPAQRRKGLTRALVEAAVRFARSRGAKIVEAYPVQPRREVAHDWLYTGVASTFDALGFEEVARRSTRRRIVRKILRRAGPGRRARPGSPAGASNAGRAAPWPRGARRGTLGAWRPTPSTSPPSSRRS